MVREVADDDQPLARGGHVCRLELAFRAGQTRTVGERPCAGIRRDPTPTTPFGLGPTAISRSSVAVIATRDTSRLIPAAPGTPCPAPSTVGLHHPDRRDGDAEVLVRPAADGDDPAAPETKPRSQVPVMSVTEVHVRASLDRQATAEESSLPLAEPTMMNWPSGVTPMSPVTPTSLPVLMPGIGSTAIAQLGRPATSTRQARSRCHCPSRSRRGRPGRASRAA